MMNRVKVNLVQVIKTEEVFNLLKYLLLSLFIYLFIYFGNTIIPI